MVKHGIEVICIGYHQQQDAREFRLALDACDDKVARHSVYVSVEAANGDVDLGNQLFGPSNHLICMNNVGHATACNLAAAWRVEYDTLFFCNADTRLYTGVMDRCFETLWSDETYGCVGPRQISADGRITAAGIFGTQAAPKHRGWMERTDAYQDLRDDAVMASGSLYMIKRSVWNELWACPNYQTMEKIITGEEPKGAMPAVKHYYSETWPSYHMAAHGFKNVYEGRVTARHDWHKASPEGGWGEMHLSRDREHFRQLCDRHFIPHD